MEFRAASEHTLGAAFTTGLSEGLLMPSAIEALRYGMGIKNCNDMSIFGGKNWLKGCHLFAETVEVPEPLRHNS